MQIAEPRKIPRASGREFVMAVKKLWTSSLVSLSHIFVNRARKKLSLNRKQMVTSAECVAQCGSIVAVKGMKL